MSSVQFSLILPYFLIVFCARLAVAQKEPKSPPVTALAISSDGKYVVAGSQAGVEIRAWPSLEKTGRLATTLPHVHDIQFSPDGKLVLVVGGAPGETGELELWSWSKKLKIAAARSHEDVIYRTAWNQTGDQVMTASADGSSKIYSIPKLDDESTYKGHSAAILAALYAPNSEDAITASVDQTIQVWKPRDTTRIRGLSNHVGAVIGLAMRPSTDERPLILASISEDRTVRLWQPTIGRLMRFTKLPSSPSALQWSRSGEALFVGSNDGVIRELDFESLTIKRELPGMIGRIHEVLRHPHDDDLLIGGEFGLKVIELRSER